MAQLKAVSGTIDACACGFITRALEEPSMTMFERAAPFMQPEDPLKINKGVTFALGAFVYLFSGAIRCLDYPRWLDDMLRIGDEFIMGTHDAYFWLAGAKSVGSATNQIMAILTEAIARMGNVPVGQVGFWGPAVMASLVALACFLWGRLLAGTGAGVFAGIMGSLAPGYFFRTRLGYFATDIVTLTFPLLLSYGVAAWLMGRLNPLPFWPKSDQQEEVDAQPLWIPLALGLMAAFFQLWHHDIQNFNAIVFCLATLLALFLGKANARPYLLFGLLLFALCAFAGWYGRFAAILLFAVRDTHPKVKEFYYKHTLVNLALLVAIALAGDVFLGPVRSVWHKANIYLKPLADMAHQDVLTFPGITQSVVEAQNIPLHEILQALAPYDWLVFVGFLGMLAVTLVHPTAIFLLPLAGMSVLASKFGSRVTMFGGPAVALGSGILLQWALQRFLPEQRRKQYLVIVLQAALSLILIIPWLNLYSQVGPTPVLSKFHAMALTQLAQISPPNSQIWTWWDWGYATDYYARRKSFSDGGKHSGTRVFPVGLALSTPSPLHSTQVIKFITSVSTQGSDGSEVYQNKPAAEVNAFFDSLATVKREFPKLPNQYLVVTWENLRLMYWISFYGTWDFVTKNGMHFQCLEINKTINIDHNQGRVTLAGEAPITISSVDIITSQGVQRRKFSNNIGPHLIFNQLRGEGYLMDDNGYNSMMVQLLISDLNDPRFTDYFSLAWEGFPEVRIYQVK
jgi:dolichyl-diphosphooligosaccharide--protein glycosyltransferase